MNLLEKRSVRDCNTDVPVKTVLDLEVRRVLEEIILQTKNRVKNPDSSRE